MNLKVHLVLRIIFVASVCFAAVTVYVVLHAHRDVMGRAEVTAERMAKQLALQLVRISAGTDLPARFPDWYVFDPQHLYGMCARFVAVDGATLRSACEGTDLSSRSWPAWFEIAYRRFFVPAKETERPVTLHTQVRGVVVVTPTAEREIGEAWQAVRELLGLTVVTVFALCLMTYASLARVLRPAAQIVVDLERMHQGDLAHRLPRFELVEFEKISAMVNRLAGSLDRSMAARAELNRKLLSAHEEERRWLTRELHDEIGQCLAGINALSASISYTAERECPRLVQEAVQIGHIVEHMMGLVQNLLARLRPPELDELGLCECLRRLVQGWNDRSAGRTIFELEIRGALETVPPVLTGHLYRIVQESLSNASKHAAATRVCTRLEITPREPSSLSRSERVEVIVEDNGVAKAPLADGDFGLGLRGMKERVTALGGNFTLQTRAPSVSSYASCCLLIRRRRRADDDACQDPDLLVDDHAIVRHGDRTLLQKQPDMEVVGEAVDAADAYARYQEAGPDVVIMDISLPGQSGIEAITRIRQRNRSAKVLVFTMHQSASFAIQATRAGAFGYITKSSAPEVLVRAVYEVHAGRHALSPDIAQTLAISKLRGEHVPLGELSPREFEILRMLVGGRSTREIAEALHLSPKTVANGHYEIKRKIGVKSDIELVHLALRLQVIDLLEVVGDAL